MKTNKHTACLVCSSTNIKARKGYYNTKGLVTCKTCSFVFMERIPTLSELNAHYDKYAYDRVRALSPITVKSYNDLLDEFEPYRKTNRILDVGCGRGWFLIEAQKRGWEIHGTEYSTKAIELCKESGIAMKKGQLTSEMFPKDHFDLVTSFEVIEHINNPNEEMELIAQFVRTDGLFYCTTPNFNSLMRYLLKEEYKVIGYPEHLSYYTKKTLSKVVEQHAFKQHKFLSTGVSFSHLKSSRMTKKAKTKTETTTANTIKAPHEISTDEALRQQIDTNVGLQVLKKTANNLMTWTNTGMSLKGYFIKI